MPRKAKVVKNKKPTKKPRKQKQKQSVNVNIKIDNSRKTRGRPRSTQQTGRFTAKSPVMSSVPMITNIMPANATDALLNKPNDAQLRETKQTNDLLNQLILRPQQQPNIFNLGDNKNKQQSTPSYEILNDDDALDNLYDKLFDRARIYGAITNGQDNFQENVPVSSFQGVIPKSNPEPKQQIIETVQDDEIPDSFQQSIPQSSFKGSLPAVQEGVEESKEGVEPEIQQEEQDFVKYPNDKGYPKSYKTYIKFAVSNNMVNESNDFNKQYKRYLKGDMNTSQERDFANNTFKNALKTENARNVMDEMKLSFSSKRKGK